MNKEIKIFYIVEHGGVTQYERIGECKKCGECCTKKMINYRTDTKPKVEKNTNWVKIDYKNWDGWSYFHAFSCWWRFKINKIEQKRDPCKALKRNRCIYHNQNIQPAICRFWPMNPSAIKEFPGCGYSFIKIKRGWK